VVTTYYLIFAVAASAPEACIKRGMCAYVIVMPGSFLGLKFWLRVRAFAMSLRKWDVLELDLEGESVDERFDEFFSDLVNILV